jgi:hypothetical protein
VPSCSAKNRVNGGSSVRLANDQPADTRLPTEVAIRRGTWRFGPGTPAAAQIRATNSATGRGSPFDTTNA